MRNDADTQDENAGFSIAEDLSLSPVHSEEGLDRVTRLLAHSCATPLAAFWVVDRDRQFLASVSGALPREIPRGSGLADQTLRQDDIFAVEDALRDARFADDPLATGGPKLRFFAGVPVCGRDRRQLGVLCVFDTQARTLDPTTRAALTDLRAILEDHLRLRADALHDPQTGALARRRFEEIAGREWRRSMRGLTSISLIVAELDLAEDFARREGAEVLDRGTRAAALAMQYSLHRPGDCVCRYDGSRFAMLLPTTDERGAEEAAERVRAAVEALQIPFPGTEPGVLTISLGIETVHSEALGRGGLREAVQAATRALRQAQRDGGNRVALFRYLDEPPIG